MAMVSAQADIVLFRVYQPTFAPGAICAASTIPERYYSLLAREGKANARSTPKTHALLVDHAGKLLWCVEGISTDEKVRALQRALDDQTGEHSLKPSVCSSISGRRIDDEVSGQPSSAACSRWPPLVAATRDTNCPLAFTMRRCVG